MMWYLSERSFWRFILVIVVFHLKHCKPKRNPQSGEQGAPDPRNIAPPGMVITTLDTLDQSTIVPQATPALNAAGAEQNRFTTPTTTQKRFFRTTPLRVSFAEPCDYLAHYCLKAYDTGKLCGRTLYYGYYTFRNYCMLDYVNCRERFEVWQVVHMGECYKIKELTEYLLYPYDDDYFLDQYYIMEDHK